MFRANIFIKKFMILFVFNLYKQINLFTKHIFTNKFITTSYYIYGGVLPGGWCPRGVGGVLPGMMD